MGKLADFEHRHAINNVRYMLEKKYSGSRWTKDEVERIWVKIKADTEKIDEIFEEELSIKKDNKGITWKEQEEEYMNET